MTNFATKNRLNSFKAQEIRELDAHRPLREWYGTTQLIISLPAVRRRGNGFNSRAGMKKNRVVFAIASCENQKDVEDRVGELTATTRWGIVRIGNSAMRTRAERKNTRVSYERRRYPPSDTLLAPLKLCWVHASLVDVLGRKGREIECWTIFLLLAPIRGQANPRYHKWKQ